MTDIYGKGAKGKATRLHAQLVRSRGVCEAREWPLWVPFHACSGKLETAHLISRKALNTRTDLDNAACLCSGAHFYFTNHPLDFGVFVEWWARDTGRMSKAEADGFDEYGLWLMWKRDRPGKWTEKAWAARAVELAELVRLTASVS